MRDYAHPVFTKKHYEVTARIIAETLEDIRNGKESAGYYVIHNFIDAFKADNSRFKVSTFETRIAQYLQRYEEEPEGDEPDDGFDDSVSYYQALREQQDDQAYGDMLEYESQFFEE